MKRQPDTFRTALTVVVIGLMVIGLGLAIFVSRTQQEIRSSAYYKAPAEARALPSKAVAPKK